MDQQPVPVRVTYDEDADAAYIYLADEPALGWRHGETVPLDLGPDNRMVNIDFDDDGRLIGIEVLGGRALLSEKLLWSLGNRGNGRECR